VIRPLGVLAALALAALVVQGALSALLPPALVPDLGLLVAVVAAVSAPPIPALLVAAGVGYGADLMSGTLLGEQALLRLIAFAATRFVSAQFHLERGLPLATFGFAVGALEPVGLAALSSLFAGASPFGWEALPTVATRAVLLAVLASPAQRLVAGLLGAVQQGETRRREVRFETRRPVL
jgi:cell shape-determining protein MreD